MLLSIASYSRLLGVHPQTLRRWEREGKTGIVQPTRTPGNHRRYAVEADGDLTLGYARVSCHDQKDDLPRQAECLRLHGQKDGRKVEVITVTILDAPEQKPPAETFAADVLAILTVFSAKLHGARAHRPKSAPLAP